MKRLPLWITISGAVPFVAFSVAASQGYFEDTRQIIEGLLTYSAIILSFLGGVHWGVAVSNYGNNKSAARLLLIEGVIPPLLAWAIVLQFSVHIQLLALTLLFTGMWAVDSLLYRNELLPYWFFELRCLITPIVVVSLYVAYFGII